jgi:hypothetical protein
MRLLLLGAITLLAICQAQAQTAVASDSSLQRAVQAARQRYLVGAPAPRLYNGVAYVSAAPANLTGQPFYQTSTPQPATLHYDGQEFANVRLLYEQVQDQVLLYDSTQVSPLQLIRQQVQSFELLGHRFVWLPDAPAGGLAEGFYDLVVDGPAQLLVKRSKKIEAATGGYSLKGTYEEKTQFFIQRQGKFYVLTTLNQALKALADKKLDMQAYSRENRLRYVAESREESLSALVKRYNLLIERGIP